MRPIRSYHVAPSLPERLRAIEELAYNLRWSWEHDTIALFRRLDRDLWERTRHNPVLLLGSVSQERLEEAAEDEAFLAHLDRCAESLKVYTSGTGSWYRRECGTAERPVVAYFSMEFGVTECLPIYSGGLGILAGDHLKSASELGIPLIGVGLLYQKGYFRQYLSQEGWQQERNPINDFSTLPVRPCRDGGKEAVTIRVDLGGRPVEARLWRIEIGRVTLLLLDTNLPSNPPDLQGVTDELYGGDKEMRIRQEILLGIGGVRALHALDLHPQIYHMNEGHCAFLTFERCRDLMRREGLTFAEAREVIGASTVFTTHTPVPAGTDVFDAQLVERYFSAYRHELGLESEQIVDLGRQHEGRRGEPLNMTVLALRSCCTSNGVSRLHGEVSRAMWRDVWPGVPVNEVPIAHVTNGIHPGSWISHDLRGLFERYLGPRWSEQPGDTAIWKRAEQIPGEELWRTHERRRERLVAFARNRLMDQLRRRGAGARAIADAQEALDPNVLTLGFARRFATYKRATLLLRDEQRLDRILNDPDRPVQIIFAGKAHPKDDLGKALIRDIVHLAQKPQFRRRILFLEDYDAVTTRYMVQGVDVWLNTPRRPEEASGTSGMKAAFNGVLNLSILDGWWDEAYSPRVGWAIGQGEVYEDHDYQDRVEAGALYDLLEREVAPLFYRRGSDGIPRDWVARMKHTLGELCPEFNTNRMVHQYYVQTYAPALERRGLLEADAFRRARHLSRWRAKVDQGWSRVRIGEIEADPPRDLRVGHEFTVRAHIDPGPMDPEDLAVEIYVGGLDPEREIADGWIVPLALERTDGDGSLRFQGTLQCQRSGTVGLTIRVLPSHPDLAHIHCARRILWAG